VDMFGDSFSPGATLVFFKDGVPTGHVFADNSTLAWFAYDHIKATITVDSNADKGTYDVLVTLNERTPHAAAAAATVIQDTLASLGVLVAVYAVARHLSTHGLGRGAPDPSPA